MIISSGPVIKSIRDHKFLPAQELLHERKIKKERKKNNFFSRITTFIVPAIMIHFPSRRAVYRDRWASPPTKLHRPADTVQDVGAITDEDRTYPS